MGTAASIARNLGAQRQGNNWCCACPCGCGYALSLTEGRGGRLLAHCFGGCDFHDILTSLVEYGLLDDDIVDLSYETPIRERTTEDQKHCIRAACWVYDQSVDAAPVRNYLRAREIALSSSVLRFCQNAPHRLGTRLHAMAAPVVNNSGEQIGTHLTYLRADGSAKADFTDPALQRECRGEIRGGAIRLAAHDPNRELVVGEGVESTLSAMQIFDLPGWSAINADNLKNHLELPTAIRRIVIAADNDASGTGQNAAREARRRWRSQGRSVRVAMPSRVGSDFNDVLRGM